jgi:hypothetical protein
MKQLKLQRYKMDQSICKIEWCVEDLVTALKKRGIEVTDDNIEAILTAEFSKKLVERSIERGWEIINDML